MNLPMNMPAKDMTLRDHIAIEAMQSMIGAHWNASKNYENLSIEAYKIADAMLLTRVN